MRISLLDVAAGVRAFNDAILTAHAAPDAVVLTTGLFRCFSNAPRYPLGGDRLDLERHGDKSHHPFGRFRRTEGEWGVRHVCLGHDLRLTFPQTLSGNYKAAMGEDTVATWLAFDGTVPVFDNAGRQHDVKSVVLAPDRIVVSFRGGLLTLEVAS